MKADRKTAPKARSNIGIPFSLVVLMREKESTATMCIFV